MKKGRMNRILNEEREDAARNKWRFASQIHVLTLIII